MGTYDLNQATASDYSNAIKDVTIAAADTDGAGEQKETRYNNKDWTKQYGLFNSVPDLQSALLMKAAWDVGKGYNCDPETEVILDHITGWGKDSFRDILLNADVTRYIGGDSFTEIVWDDDTGNLLNLKPLNPGTIDVIVNGEGILIRYEQMSRIQGKANKKFKPKEIFHLCNNRVADSIHGISKITILTSTIEADNESFVDIKKIMHHQAKPFILWKLKTDIPATIASIITKINNARNLGEDMFIPDDDDTITHEVVDINLNSMLFEWRNDIRNKFYRNVGLPQIVPGAGGQSTESESKVIYLAFEQLNENDQKFLEDQVWQQLNLRIDLIPAATLSQDLQADNSKDGGMTPQPSDTTAGVGR